MSKETAVRGGMTGFVKGKTVLLTRYYVVEQHTQMEFGGPFPSEGMAVVAREEFSKRLGRAYVIVKDETYRTVVR